MTASMGNFIVEGLFVVVFVVGLLLPVRRPH
jgi:hypothetical protein